MAIHPIAVQIFSSGQKFWTDRPQAPTVLLLLFHRLCPLSASSLSLSSDLSVTSINIFAVQLTTANMTIITVTRGDLYSSTGII